MSSFERETISNMPTATEKFKDPDWTAKGELRAFVPLRELETLWVNTGSLCNIECANCYIKSSPTNDQLAYISAVEVAAYLDEIQRDKLGTSEIGFTGGEPFMNPEFLTMLEDALQRGFKALILTNGMKPMQRPKIKQALLALKELFGQQMTIRVSLDHYTKKLHDIERGAGSFEKALSGLDWLSQNGFKINLAGRTVWLESEEVGRQGYSDLIDSQNWSIDALNPRQLILFPEMNEAEDVPEITTACWTLLNIRPDSMMCANSRMLIKRRGAANTQLVPCTLIAYDESFEMGDSLKQASQADGGMFANGAVKLCHPYCAKFCVLGGGSCSV